MKTYKIVVKGIVQGVGFRPFVYQLATKYKLLGEVLNDSLGVDITINATNEELRQFIDDLKSNLPVLAKIDTLEIKEIDFREFSDFKIVQTQESSTKTALLPPDISICKECEKELFDKINRRYLYPFITCTNCGVRYSIIENLPYDRVNTSMRFFKMCKACEKEYSNPLDRRYHAQPIGCWECGPTLELRIKSEELRVSGLEAIGGAVELLRSGGILAVKGVGGYHLVCDATNSEAIAKLRERKRRPTKPFALMVKDIEMAKGVANISKKEEELLTSKERPIVILNSSLSTLHSSIAPNISKIGLFLPYTPLHLLILKELNRPIVATSANVTDEPICTNIKSLEKLQNVYDAVLEHNREIVNGCDDSVLMVVKDRVITLRRARGYTPISVKLPFKLEQKTLALGANQKSTVAIGFDREVILSPHIGDLDSIGSVEYYKKNIETLFRIYGFKPEVVAHDLHPNYESTKLAKEFEGVELREVQHHFAHILGVMVEYKLKGKVFGVAFDGTGLGDDGNLWGGEFLICDYKGFERVAHIENFKLLGGEKAIKEPKRVALSLLFECFGKNAINLNIPTIKAFSQTELNALYIAWQKGLNAPLSSSAGRLFDAIASLVGVNQVVSYEGESGLMLEELYNRDEKSSYPFEYTDGKIDIHLLVKAIIKEDSKSKAVSKFFNTLIEIIATVYKDYSHLPLVASGGVFQNRVLLELLLERFPNAYIPSQIPPNDGGIALGQTASLN